MLLSKLSILRNQIPQIAVHYFTIIAIIIGWIISLYSQFENDISQNISVLFLLISVLRRSLLTLLPIAFLLWLGRESIRDIGFRKENTKKQILIGVSFGIGIFVISHVIIGPIIRSFFPSNAPNGIEQSHLFKSLLHLPIWIFLSIAGGGFLEELERSFTLNRFERCFGKAGLFISLILTSIVFGCMHLYQGRSSAISIGIDGFLYGLVYIRKRSAIEAISSHACFDVIGVIIAYIFYYGS